MSCCRRGTTATTITWFVSAVRKLWKSRTVFRLNWRGKSRHAMASSPSRTSWNFLESVPGASDEGAGFSGNPSRLAAIPNGSRTIAALVFFYGAQLWVSVSISCLAGIGCAELAARSIVLRDKLGTISGHGHLLALVHGHGICRGNSRFAAFFSDGAWLASGTFRRRTGHMVWNDEHWSGELWRECSGSCTKAVKVRALRIERTQIQHHLHVKLFEPGLRGLR